jgi:hypothetical protein
MDYPEFNMYSSPEPIQAFGWDGLRRIMEDNAPALRKPKFIRPDWMLFLASKGAASLNEQIPLLSVCTETGKLLLCPLIDSNGYRSVLFMFEGEGPSPDQALPEWADQLGENLGWPKKLRRWPGNN